MGTGSPGPGRRGDRPTRRRATPDAERVFGRSPKPAPNVPNPVAPCSMFCSMFHASSALYFGPFGVRDLCQMTDISVRMYNSSKETTSATLHGRTTFMEHSRGGTHRTLQPAGGHARLCALSRSAPLRHGDRNRECRHQPRATHSSARPTADHDGNCRLCTSREAPLAAAAPATPSSDAGQAATRPGEMAAALARPAMRVSRTAACARAVEHGARLARGAWNTA